MNKAAETLAKWFGSVPFIIFHIVWFALWFVFGLPIELLTLVVSLEAIFLTLFVLRSENTQSERLEKYIKQAVKDTKKDLKLGSAILKEVKDQRFQR